MTNKELQEKLKEYPDNADIVVEGMYEFTIYYDVNDNYVELEG